MKTKRNGIDGRWRKKHNEGNLMLIRLFKNMTLFIIFLSRRKEARKKMQIIDETSFQTRDSEIFFAMYPLCARHCARV